MNDIVLDVRNLSKKFKIYNHAQERVVEWASFGKKTTHEEFWAVKDVSFQVRRGQVMGVIGPNGAGKTTLLKMVSGILEPTSGDSSMQGRHLSLFDLSTGHDPQLSGRENVLRSSQLFGFSAQHAAAQMDRIEMFASLGDFFDRPMKTYSTGMRTRLSFSTFAFLEPELLILDEVLAVGDIFFRQRCYQRIDELVERGTSIIMVSHNFTPIARYCDEVITLHQGELIYRGKPKEAIHAFMEIRGVASILPERPLKQDGAQRAEEGEEESAKRNIELYEFSICNANGEAGEVYAQGETVTLVADFVVHGAIDVPVIAFQIVDEFNLLIHAKNSLQYLRPPEMAPIENGKFRFKIDLDLDLAPNHYILNLNLYEMSPEIYARIDELDEDEIKHEMKHIVRKMQLRKFLILSIEDRDKKSFFNGICDLNGDCEFEMIEEV